MQNSLTTEEFLHSLTFSKNLSQASFISKLNRSFLGSALRKREPQLQTCDALGKLLNTSVELPGLCVR